MCWRGVNTGSRHSHGDEQSCLSWGRLEWLGWETSARNTLTSKRVQLLVPLEKPQIKTCICVFFLPAARKETYGFCWKWIILCCQSYVIKHHILTCRLGAALNSHLLCFLALILSQFCVSFRPPPGPLLSALLVYPNAHLPCHRNCKTSLYHYRPVCVPYHNIFLHELSLFSCYGPWQSAKLLEKSSIFKLILFNLPYDVNDYNNKNAFPGHFMWKTNKKAFVFTSS